MIPITVSIASTYRRRGGHHTPIRPLALLEKSVLRGGSVCLNRLAQLLSGASAGFTPLREAVG